MKIATMKIITTTDAVETGTPRILYADKIEPATLKPGYIILDECRTIALADIIMIVPTTVSVGR
jgi:hypothetical protein